MDWPAAARVDNGGRDRTLAVEGRAGNCATVCVADISAGIVSYSDPIPLSCVRECRRGHVVHHSMRPPPADLPSARLGGQAGVERSPALAPQRTAWATSTRRRKVPALRNCRCTSGRLASQTAGSVRTGGEDRGDGPYEIQCTRGRAHYPPGSLIRSSLLYRAIEAGDNGWLFADAGRTIHACRASTAKKRDRKDRGHKTGLEPGWRAVDRTAGARTPARWTAYKHILVWRRILMLASRYDSRGQSTWTLFRAVLKAGFRCRSALRKKNRGQDRRGRVLIPVAGVDHTLFITADGAVLRSRAQKRCAELHGGTDRPRSKGIDPNGGRKQQLISARKR